jgi:2-desacetyl-2-hydroxyethyl bacteriochlorophyllide A dehydrogenase
MVKTKSLWFRSQKEVGFREEEVNISRDDEILVETLYSGISHGTERLIYRGEVAEGLQLDSSVKTLKGRFPFPVKYGYSNVGKVVETGEKVSRLQKGDIIFAFNPHETKYVISENEAVKLPADTSPLHGVFIASVETAINVVLDSDIKLGESVVIFGQGTVGLFITQLMRKSGADKVFTVDKIQKRRDISLKLGADFSFDPDRDDLPAAIMELTDGIGADVIIEASGSPSALNNAIKLTAFQGLIVVVSWYGTKPVTLNLGAEFHRKRIRIKSSQVSFIDPALTPRWNTKRRMALALKLLPQLNLDDLLAISRIYHFEEAEEAYELIDKNPEEVLQVILSYV